MLLGLTKKKLIIGGGVAAVAAFLLWRRFKGNQTPAQATGWSFNPGALATGFANLLERAVGSLPKPVDWSFGDLAGEAVHHGVSGAGGYEREGGELGDDW